MSVSTVIAQAEDGKTVTIEIEYVSPITRSGFDTYQEPVYSAAVSDGGVLFLDSGDGRYSVVSPTGYTRVSVVQR